MLFGYSNPNRLRQYATIPTSASYMLKTLLKDSQHIKQALNWDFNVKNTLLKNSYVTRPC